MNLNPYEIALISVGGTIAGSLVGAILGYRLSLSSAKILARRNSAVKMREAFRDEILALNPAQQAIQEDLSDYLGRAFHKHRLAVFEFSFYLNEREKQKFNAAWYEYCCHEKLQNEHTVPFLEQYTCRGLTLPQEHDMKKRVLSRFEKILSFTND